jgi:hypothetical protein
MHVLVESHSQKILRGRNKRIPAPLSQIWERGWG